jgi:formylmethanofuran dehydrogenase subunit E
MRRRTEEQKKVEFDDRPLCYVCGLPVEGEKKLVRRKVKDGDKVRVKMVQIMVYPINLGKGIFRHDTKKCTPGSALYMKKLGCNMKVDIKDAFLKKKTEVVNEVEKKNKGQWVCSKCGHVVIAQEKPKPIKWDDGHVCYFEPDLE